MRTRFSHKRDPSHSRAALWSVVLLAIAAILLVFRLLAPDLLLVIARPVFAIGDGVSTRVTGLFATTGDARALAAKNSELEAENASLQLANAGLTAKAADLTALIGTTTPPGRGIVAGVVARPPEAPYDTLVVSGGTDAGIASLMEAEGPLGTPLGVVEGVTADFARVRLFSAAGVVTDAWVGEARVPILLRGTGGSFTATLPQGSGVATDDLVYLAGPGALPVARVAEVTGASSDPVATLVMAPLVNVLSLSWIELAESPASASSTLLAPLAP